jgi:hypothetical protein
MRRIRIEKPKAQRARSWPDALHLDPRDPHIVRGKALERCCRQREHEQERGRRESEMSLLFTVAGLTLFAIVVALLGHVHRSRAPEPPANKDVA